jgi:hypothetical protein
MHSFVLRVAFTKVVTGDTKIRLGQTLLQKMGVSALMRRFSSPGGLWQQDIQIVREARSA